MKKFPSFIGSNVVCFLFRILYCYLFAELNSVKHKRGNRIHHRWNKILIWKVMKLLQIALADTFDSYCSDLFAGTNPVFRNRFHFFFFFLMSSSKRFCYNQSAHLSKTRSRKKQTRTHSHQLTIVQSIVNKNI